MEDLPQRQALLQGVGETRVSAFNPLQPRGLITVPYLRVCFPLTFAMTFEEKHRDTARV
jgi:hypothetical protein